MSYFQEYTDAGTETDLGALDRFEAFRNMVNLVAPGVIPAMPELTIDQLFIEAQILSSPEKGCLSFLKKG